MVNFIRKYLELQLEIMKLEGLRRVMIFEQKTE
jgi:hypothetical protein